MADEATSNTASKEASKPKASPQSTATPESTTPDSGLKSLRNRNDFQLELEYGGDVVFLPPLGTVNNIDPAKLGTLPAGVISLPNMGN